MWGLSCRVAVEKTVAVHSDTSCIQDETRRVTKSKLLKDCKRNIKRHLKFAVQALGASVMGLPAWYSSFLVPSLFRVHLLVVPGT